jgi:hypothetical protein
MSSTDGSSSPTSSYCTNCGDSTISFDSNEFYTKKRALKKRSDEMFQVAVGLIQRKSEYAEYAADKYVDALNAYTRHGETEWDAIFDGFDAAAEE